MSKYIVRASLTYSFALDCIMKGQKQLDLYYSALQEKMTVERLLLRYTFSVLRVEAESRKECLEALSYVWKEQCPENAGDMSFLITPDTGDDAADLMAAIYKGYYGVLPYQQMTTELTAQIAILREKGALEALRRQNYLFAIDSGCGFTTLLSSFGDYLNRMSVYDDPDKKRANYAEYRIGGGTENGTCTAYDTANDLKKILKDNIYNVIGVDISYFLGDDKLDELRDFIKKLHELQNEFVFVFRIPFLEKKALDNVAAILSDVASFRVVQIPPLHDAVLMECFYDVITKYGYTIDDSLAETFFDRVREEKRDGHFYGFKTVEKIAQEAVLQKAAHDSLNEANGETADGSTISPDDVYGFAAVKKTDKSGYEQLSELIGMEKITERVKEIVSQVKLAAADERLDRPCIHMRFLGAPGTGKTTVARIIGQIFREEGLLRKGAFMEYTARSLCAEYVGQTAARTAAVCRDSYGSVLFIDEAYALYQDDTHTNDYGKEALTTLISEMENHRDDMLVIMAGYTDDMETLMKGNAGLRSRMPYAITFENYTREQLFEIFMLMVRKHFDFTPEFENGAHEYFRSLSDELLSSREFANARFVRNLYERTWSKAALRASHAGANKITLSRDDFIAASSEKEFSEKLEQKKRIGF
ncbi:MAG: AAA family ATPase [Clostridia bacterium]|nr:AAA family ATPase [Clostridia bacterium]